VELYLVRHAEALDVGEAGIASDAERPLSAQGEADARLQGRALRALEVEPTVVLSSPLLRARQTAALLGGDRGAWRVTLWAPLAVGGALEEVVARVASAKAHDVLVLVGHEPQLGALLQTLLCGAGHPPIPLAKAMVVALKRAHRHGEVKLRWVLSAKLTQAFLPRG
jgi:phosphohistidine phosphatase